MSPEFDGTMPDINAYKFVRVGKRIVYDKLLSGQHSQIAEDHGVEGRIGEGGKLIVDDAGGIAKHPSGEIKVYGETTSCIVDGDPSEARIETERIINEFEENKLRSTVKPHILKCRDGDWNHSLRVVSWVKKLGKDRGDLKLLTTAAYLHDVGWKNVLPKGKITLQRLREFEKEANSNSKALVVAILTGLEYSTAEIDTVNRLIKSADNRNPNTADEKIITDSDNLSKLNIKHLEEKYQMSEWERMLMLWTEVFPKRIKTNEAMKLYPQLLEKLGKEIEKQN